MLVRNSTFHALLAYEENQPFWENISEVQTTWDQWKEKKSKAKDK